MADIRDFGGERRRAIGVAQAAAVVVALGASPASAEGLFDFLSGRASPDVVEQSVNRYGYALSSAIVRRGDVYVCDGVDGVGRRARLVLDAHSGAFIRAYPLDREVAPAPRSPPRDVTWQARSQQTSQESRQETWRPARLADSRSRTPADDWSFAPRPPIDVPLRRPYQEYYVDVGPQEGARVPEAVPQQRVVARGPALSLPSDLPPATPRPNDRPDKPKPHVVKATPSPDATPINSAAVDTGAATPAGNTIVVPASTVAPGPAPETIAPPQTPKTIEANFGAPPPAAAPPKRSINDIPVAPLD